MNQLVRIGAMGLLMAGLVPVTTQAQEAGKEVPVQAAQRYTQEIQTLAKQPKVQQAFQLFQQLEPWTLQHLRTLTEIPAPPFKEEVRGRKYAELLRAAGADSVWTDEVGNVIAKRRGKTGKKTVVLEAHLDTVFPEETDVKIKQRGDTLLAPGIGDDTQGLAMVLTVLEVMEKTGIETEADVLFIGTVGEEGLGDLRGVKKLFDTPGLKIDSYIAIDGLGASSITHRGLGSHRYEVTFKGPGGHSSGAFGLVNPHGALGRAIYYFTQEADKFTRQGVRTTYNVGMVGGGTSVNAIPFESWMQVDLRSESPEQLAGIDKLLQEAVQRALREENAMKRLGPDLTVDVKLVGDRPSGSLDQSHALVQRAIAATRQVQQEPALRVGSTNANTPFSKGVPAITIGAGGKGGGAHALDEWFINDRAYLAMQRTLLILLAEAGLR
ncbi:M20/M25/M40 family metallo-hydrolase [Telluribacter sp.]|jgi:acetylornithine deacetylase/succinyl-diaminopimelate desuccinylase-like protein|uniref:M20/M25/M40 family metallo-hydrolase n=1 Tax=Telluribacter sp. TaxID=1978767 RepID=UPI002E13369F|nr:M20/M25/M40 family metallo-hydrolase [Telluribacter sp.]